MLTEKEIEQIRLDAEKKYPAQMDSITTTDGNRIEYDYNEELRECYISGRTEEREAAKALVEIGKEIDEYLSQETSEWGKVTYLNSVGAKSILHKKLSEALSNYNKK